MFMLLLHNDNDNDDVDVDYDDFMADSCEHNCIIEFNRLRKSETGFVLSLLDKYDADFISQQKYAHNARGCLPVNLQKPTPSNYKIIAQIKKTMVHGVLESLCIVCRTIC